MAIGRIERSNAISCVGRPTDPWAKGSDRRTQLGWTAGAGAEWKLSGNWSLKAVNLYVDFGSEKGTLVGTAHSGLIPVGGGCSIRSEGWAHDLNMHIGRVGLSYKF